MIRCNFSIFKFSRFRFIFSEYRALRIIIREDLPFRGFPRTERAIHKHRSLFSRALFSAPHHLAFQKYAHTTYLITARWATSLTFFLGKFFGEERGGNSFVHKRFLSRYSILNLISRSILQAVLQMPYRVLLRRVSFSWALREKALRCNMFGRSEAFIKGL